MAKASYNGSGNLNCGNNDRGNNDSGKLLISIDLEWDIQQRAHADGRRLEDITARLLEQLSHYRQPATWAVADPTHSAATDAILASDLPHELAVLGDSTWVGPGTSRARFAREISRRFEGARSAGLTVSSLLLKSVRLDDHLDLLVKHGISLLRQSSEAKTSAKLTTTQSLRFGLWKAEESARLPGTSRWLGGGGGYTARRLIKRASLTGKTVHLVIDAPRLIDRGTAGLQLLQGVLRYAEKQRQRGMLQILSARQLVEALSPKQESQPSRSILRAA